MKEKKNLNYLEQVHRDGRIWGIIICLLIFAFPVALSLIFGALPNTKALAQGLFAGRKARKHDVYNFFPIFK